MKLISFRFRGEARYGAAVAGAGDRIVDLRSVDDSLPPTLKEALPRLRNYALPDGAPTLAVADIELLPVIPDPQKIICIGVNYADHASETGAGPPPYPTVFAKFASSLLAHGAPIVLPAASTMPDFEGELAVIIGTPGKHITASAALDHVAGYTALDDVSARDFQGHTSQWTMGKAVDTFAPVGPVMVTADEIPDPQQLRLRTTVSGEVMQDASTADMIFSVRELIAYLSQTMTLFPGDIIATGTPAGVGVARSPQRFLQPGDTVTVSIDDVTELTNPVVAERA